MTRTLGELDTPDVIVVVIYFVAIIVVGILASCVNRGSIGGYFLAGRSMPFYLVGASLFASNIGSGHFIGLAGSGASNGVAVALYELTAIFFLIGLGWIFVPVYVAAQIFTMPEYIHKRYGGIRIQIYLSVLALLLSIFTKVAADLYAGALFIEESIHISLYPAICILLVISGIFTILGGLSAVIWTDFIQTIIMVIGAVYLMIKSLIAVNGYQYLHDNFLNIHSSENITDSKYDVCLKPPSNSLHFMRAANDPSMPWSGVLFGLSISNAWYWWTDQVIVQRSISAKDISHSKGGALIAGWLKLLPLWLIIIPGMISRVLFIDEIGCATPESCLAACGKEVGCTDHAYPKLVLKLLPSGARGLMMSVMLSSLVSSLTSVFNSSSTIFTMDIWMRIRKRASNVEIMIVGRIFVLVMVGIGIAWIPIVKSGGQLFSYIQSVTSYLAPPIAVIYILGVFWPRCNEHGAFWSLMIGLVLGVGRFIWENVYSKARCGEEDTRPGIIKDVHFLHFGIFLFGICTISAIVISLFTHSIPREKLYRLTYWSRFSLNERDESNNTFTITNTDEKGIDNPSMTSDSQTNVKIIEEKETGKVFTASSKIDQEKPQKRVTIFKRMAYWVCGIESTLDGSTEDTLEQEEEKTLPDIREKRFWWWVLTANAAILAAATIAQIIVMF